MASATAAAVGGASRLISSGSSLCHTCHLEGVSCSMNGVTTSWSKQPFEIQRVSDNSSISLRGETSLFGAMQFHWLSGVQERRSSRVAIAADYSDSVPDSSNLIGDNGYHPLEELKNCRRVRNSRLTAAEMARTTVEANNTALLIFPGEVHCEPHEQNSWAEYQYVVDEYGEIFFEIKDSENILQDREASNFVNALIAMDIPQYENRRIEASEYSILETDLPDDIALVSQYLEFEVDDYERSDVPVDWGMPDGPYFVHPIHFSKCLSKACYSDYGKKMDRPSNGVSVWGQLRPAFIDEEIYLRRLFNGEDTDSYISEWKDEDFLSYRKYGRSTVYRLDIVKIELFSVYGVQSTISLPDFQDAEPDILVHSSAEIIERFNEEKVRCNVALRALCRKKGLHVEDAGLIGVDSLGIDVRVYCGSEVRTCRFPFKVRATSEAAAEKQIKQLLFPRAQRKRFRSHERHRDIDGF